MIMHLCALPRNRAIEIGSRTYVDPWSCKRGHFTHKLVSRRVCYECSRKSSREHMRRKYADEDYRDRVVEARREEYRNNPEHRARVLEQCRKYYQDNRDAVRARQREYLSDNSEAKAARDRDYYLNNKDRVHQNHREYAKRNPERARAWLSNARAKKQKRKLGTFGELDEFCIAEAHDLARQREEMFGFPWHVDHIIPLNADEVSGLHKYDNIQVIPAHLNIFKNRRLIYTNDLEWLADATE